MQETLSQILEKPTNKVRTIILGEKTDKKKGVIPTVVSGTGADLTMKAIDGVFGSPVQRFASINLPVIGPVGPIDVINFLIHGGFRNIRSGLTAVIGAKVVTGGLRTIGPFALPGAGSPGQLTAQSTTIATQSNTQGAPI